MQIGIDFGTSYSAAAAYRGAALHNIRFGEHAQFRTAVFFPAAVPDPADFSPDAALEAQVEAELRSARAAQRRARDIWQQRVADAEQLPAAQRAAQLALLPEPAPRSEAALQAGALRQVRRSWLEQQVRASRDARVSVSDALFGEDAIDAYIHDGFGHLVESPKSMLGYNLLPGARRVILHITTHLLQHLRLSATRQLQEPVRAAVLGRPVEFKSTLGAQGTTQALDLLREAAEAAGFEQVSFLEEPAAAAMHYHTQLARAQRSLIVDVGGGTTDLAYAQVGGSAATPQVFGCWGLAKGGTDIDIALSLDGFMPLFGRGQPSIPVHHFREAASVHSPPLQKEFRSHGYRDAPVPFRQRLLALQRFGATSLLNREAERMKIHLGTAAAGEVDLHFAEAGLRCVLDSGHRDAAYAEFLESFGELLRRARSDIGEQPESIFLTGGSSRAALIQSAIRAQFPQLPLVLGDPSLGVVSGLAAAAAQESAG